MKKTIYFIITILLIFVIIINSNEIVECIKFSFNICINNLFPSFIPFMLLSNFLISYNFINELSDIFKPLMKKFKISKNSSIVFLMSMFSGTPVNALYITNLLKNDLINIEDANNCLKFCHFANPIFILNTIGYNFLGNKEIGLKILIAHYSAAIFIGFFNKKKNKSINTIRTIKTVKNNKNNFIVVLKKSILDISNNLLIILGIITFFIMISTILNNILRLNTNYKFIYGLLEMTQGLKYLAISNISFNLKIIISTFLISFGGISIHIQVFSIIQNKKIRYIPYLVSRIIHGILSSFIIIIMVNYNL